ncbi:MAG: hypothetical protein IJ593_10030 [Lachnospiraceae bacterium]|nr:hypothetical protein [Lachnospiraceae bacterium]
MDNLMFIPKELVIGFKEKSNTDTGKLAYIVYKNEKNKVMKEASFESWRDKNIDVVNIENKPVSGFVIEHKVGENRYSWNPRKAYARIKDPRGYEFEIDIDNLLYILANTTCVNSVIKDKLLYSWNGSNLFLLPVNSEIYNKSIKHTNTRFKPESIAKNTLKIGATYKHKNGTELVYLGKFNTFTFGVEYKYNGEVYRALSIPDELKHYFNKHLDEYRFINDIPDGEKFVFAGTNKIRKHVYIGKSEHLYEYADAYNYYEYKNISSGQFIECLD